MDEATASVDFATDEAIQAAIRSEFKSSTLLTIAHRLSSVIDYDRLLVLSDGHVAEFDTPIVSPLDILLLLVTPTRQGRGTDTALAEPASQGRLALQVVVREERKIQRPVSGGREEGAGGQAGVKRHPRIGRRDLRTYPLDAEYLDDIMQHFRPPRYSCFS